MTRVAILLLLSAMPAAAEDFVPVRDQNEFLRLVDGRELRIGLYGLSLKVMPDGRIDGSAMGWGITGRWNWEDGYFCRDMDWSGMEIPRNCQLVEVKGDDTMRFTVDRGTGDSASFRLR